MATKIILDPGHGGYDNGASYEGRREKDDVLNLAFDVASELRRLGYDVEFTRTEDVYDSPNEKARIGNASGADYFISLHRNSSPTPNVLNGVQTLVYDDSGIKADMARNINKRLEDVGFRNINVEERKNLAVLKRTKMPALLVEVGFINNEKDNQLFDDNRARIAEAIALGIDETLNPRLETASAEAMFKNEYYGYETSMPVFAEYTGVDEPVVEEQPLEAALVQADNAKNDEDVPEYDEPVLYQILVSIFRNYGMAGYMMNQLIGSGFDATANEIDGLYQVRVGAYETIEDAMVMQDRLRKKGYDSLIVTFPSVDIN